MRKGTRRESNILKKDGNALFRTVLVFVICSWPFDVTPLVVFVVFPLVVFGSIIDVPKSNQCRKKTANERA